ncbi:MAG: outer membrane protein assembly factor BamC [Gammaproteobacteria bacterium]
MSVRSRTLFLVAVAGMAGCSKVVPKLDEVLSDKRTEYRRSQTLPDLEVPPDLTTDAIRDKMAVPEGGDTANYSTYQERRTQAQKQQEIESAGVAAQQKLANEQLVIVSGAQGEVWPRLRDFFKSAGLSLSLDDGELGVLETAWREDRDNLLRDKFKVFAEQGDDKATTALYISHVGEQLVPQGEELVWKPRASDPTLAARIAGELRNALGGEGEATVAGSPPDMAAESPAAAATAAAGGPVELINAGGGKMYIAVQREFAAAWAGTGKALTQAGVQVDESNQDRGVFVIRLDEASAPAPAAEKKGMFKRIGSKLAFWKDDAPAARQYRLTLTGVGQKTEVVVLDDDGQWVTSEPATRFLVKLRDALAKVI